MSIFDKANVTATGMRYTNSIRPMQVSMHGGETGNIRADTIDSNKEWALEIRLRQTFWANDAQRSQVETSAMRALAANLYEDVLRHLPHLRMCIHSGDAEGAMLAIDRIEQATKP